MKKLVVLSGGLVAVGSAALVGAGIAVSQPQGGSLNVVGEQYQKALQILKSQGYKGSFGGSFGGVLPQSQCLVDQQKITSGGRILLMLDCSQAAKDQIAEEGTSGGPTTGGNGIRTAIPTPMPMPPPAAAPPAG